MPGSSRSSRRTWATSTPDARRSNLKSALCLTALLALLAFASCSLFGSAPRPAATVRPPRQATARPLNLVAVTTPTPLDAWDGRVVWMIRPITDKHPLRPEQGEEAAYLIWPAEAYEANEIEVTRELGQHRLAPFYERGE